MNRREFLGGVAAVPPFLALLRDSSPGKPMIVLPDAAPKYDIGLGEARILVSGAQSSGAWWLGTFRNEPGRTTSLHVHHSADEQFYSIDGVISLWLEGRWHELSPGGLVIVPKGTPHALANHSSHPAQFLNSGNPAGYEQFFADIAQLLRRVPYGTPAFFSALMPVYKRYNTKMLGPAPR